ncbi:MAG: MarR family transcriptional regulator [Anaerolineales bacterium]
MGETNVRFQIPLLRAMLTLEMLFAVLQGLPAEHLDYLDRPWYLLAVRIEHALKEGLDPTSALHSALSNSAEWERKIYLRAFLHEEPVLALPDLTQRQKEALIALRYAGACSLSQLCRILVQDRSLIRRLDVLIEKGYAVKYFRRDGAYYLAISSPLEAETRSDVVELMQAFKQALLAGQDPPPQGDVDVPYSAEPSRNSNATGVSPRASSAHATTSTTTTRLSRESRESRLSRESRSSRSTKHNRPPRPP